MEPPHSALLWLNTKYLNWKDRAGGKEPQHEKQSKTKKSCRGYELHHIWMWNEIIRVYLEENQRFVSAVCQDIEKY